jgi:hypothetical protein
MNKRIKELFEKAHITTTRQVIKGGWYSRNVLELLKE